MKNIQKRDIFFLPILLVLLTVGTAMAGIDDSLERFFDPKPVPIDLYNNPLSLNGTYDIERFVINEGDSVILDSDNDYAVDDDRGETTVNIDMTDNTINLTFKMQMAGPAFNKGSQLVKYSFIYKNITVAIPETKNGAGLAGSLEQIGLHVYGMSQLAWEIPFEGNKTIILILEKESDKIKNISNSKYIFL